MSKDFVHQRRAKVNGEKVGKYGGSQCEGFFFRFFLYVTALAVSLLHAIVCGERPEKYSSQISNILSTSLWLKSATRTIENMA